MLLLFFAGSGERESLALWADDDNHLGCNNKKTRRRRRGGPGLLSVVNNWNDFPSLGEKKKGKFYMTFFRDYSFLFVILRRLSRWPVVVRSSFISVAYRFLVFFFLCQPKDRLPICVCKNVLCKEWDAIKRIALEVVTTCYLLLVHELPNSIEDTKKEVARIFFLLLSHGAVGLFFPPACLLLVRPSMFVDSPILHLNLIPNLISIYSA